MKQISGIRILVFSFIGFLVLTFGAAWYVTYWDNSEDMAQTEENTVSVNETEEEKISKETKITFRDYYQREDETVEETVSADADYLGMNLEETQRFLEEMNEQPQKALLDAGFVDASLVNFSSEELIIERTWFSKDMTEVYIICDENGILVAKTPDLSKTVATSAIKTDNLPESIASQIKNSRFYLTIDQVYDFLEAYSS